jgi:hypothetical protein
MDAPLTLGDLAIDFENPAAIGSIKLVELKEDFSDSINLLSLL